MAKIEVEAGLFEKILNSLANQKCIDEWDEEHRVVAQGLIDEIWNRGMEVLSEYRQRCPSNDIETEESKPKLSEFVRRVAETRECFEGGGPRVIADMDWTVEQRKEIMVILGGLSAALNQSDAIAAPGYREWAHGGILEKCAQLIELKVAGWDKSEGSGCIMGSAMKGYIDDEIDILEKIRDRDKTDYQRGMLDTFNTIERKCSEVCG